MGGSMTSLTILKKPSPARDSPLSSVELRWSGIFPSGVEFSSCLRLSWVRSPIPAPEEEAAIDGRWEGRRLRGWGE